MLAPEKSATGTEAICSGAARDGELSASAMVVASVAGGGAHSALVTRSGEAFTWGASGAGRLGHADKINEAAPRLLRLERVLGAAAPRVVQVACGSRHTLLLSEAGAVFACGANESGQLGVCAVDKVC